MPTSILLHIEAGCPRL